MTAANLLTRLTSWLGRLLADEYVQAQIAQSLTELRRSSRRAKRLKASEALKDKQLRTQLRTAVSSLINARRALAEPPPKQRPRKGALVLAVASLCAAALTWQKRSATKADA